MADESPSTGSMVQIQIQLGTLQGTINSLLGTLTHRVTGAEEAARELRTDLTHVKDNGIESVNALKTLVTQNTSAITEIRSDVTDVKEKQNATMGKVVQILSPILATLALIWAVLGGK